VVGKPLPLLAAAAVVSMITAGCGRAVMVTPPEVSDAVGAQCERASALLPGSLAAEARISTMPDPTLTAAWGAPAIVWRCGVAAPQSYNRTSQLVTVDGVEWYPEQLSAGTRFTAVAAEPMTELTVPARYANAAGVLAELQSAIAGPDGAAAPQ
jgi:hypothetical protein